MTVEELYTQIGGNYADAKSRLMNDRLVSKFVLKFPKDPSYGELVAAWDAQDADGIFRASHAMKGVCANLALTPLQKLASAITEAYRPGQEAGREAANVPALMEQLKKEYPAEVAAIQAYGASL